MVLPGVSKTLCLNITENRLTTPFTMNLGEIKRNISIFYYINFTEVQVLNHHLDIRPSKKTTCFSSPPASFFSAASLFLLFFMRNVFMSKNQRSNFRIPRQTNRRHFYLVLSSPLFHTKKLKIERWRLSAHCCCVHTKIM